MASASGYYVVMGANMKNLVCLVQALPVFVGELSERPACNLYRLHPKLSAVCAVPENAYRQQVLILAL